MNILPITLEGIKMKEIFLFEEEEWTSPGLGRMTKKTEEAQRLDTIDEVLSCWRRSNLTAEVIKGK